MDFEKICANCGAPIDLEKDKCPYCETPYINLGCIDTTKPFTLRIKTIYNGRSYIISMLVKMREGEISHSCSSIDVIAGLQQNEVLTKYYPSVSIVSSFVFDTVFPLNNNDKPYITIRECNS